MSSGLVPLRLAVLIDADNVPSRIADDLFREIAKLGDAPVRRVYGEFGGPAKGWKDAIARHGIIPRQQFPHVPGKNATDIALVIDAMDLLHGAELDGLCLVSSDSDYTGLALRLREQGLRVFGFGSKSAAASFRQACQGFTDIEMSAAGEAMARSAIVKKAAPAVPGGKKAVAPIAAAADLLVRAFARLGGNEWVPLTALLSEVRAVQPHFAAKAYGAAKPIALVRKTGCFDDELRGGTMMVRRKPATLAVAAAARAA
jgi:hypothetical protein